VVPGNTLKLESEFLFFKMGIGKVKVKATVDDQIAAEGYIKFAMLDPQGND